MTEPTNKEREAELDEILNLAATAVKHGEFPGKDNAGIPEVKARLIAWRDAEHRQFAERVLALVGEDDTVRDNRRGGDSYWAFKRGRNELRAEIRAVIASQLSGGDRQS